MGYETRLIFIENMTPHSKKKNGYRRVLASVDMAKVCYNAVGELIGKTRDATKKRHTVEVKAMLSRHATLTNNQQTVGGDYESVDGSEFKERFDEMNKLETALEKKGYAYCYADPNHAAFGDDYGDDLLIVSLEEIRKALAHDQAKQIVAKDDYVYDRYAWAIALIDSLLKSDRDITCVMWGH